MKAVRATNSINPVEAVASAIKAEADRIVQLSPKLNRDRVLSILRRTAHIRDPAPVEREYVPLGQAKDILYWLQIEEQEPQVVFLPRLLPRLEEGEEAPSSEVLTIFETEEPNALNRRLAIFDALKARESFLFRLPHLGQLVREFAEHLEDHERTLITRGRLDEGQEFDELPWLGTLLGPLYPHDPLAALQKESATIDERREFLQLKIAVLQAAAKALELGILDEELWGKCLDLLVRHLTTGKLDRYLMLDHLHYHSEWLRGWTEEAGSPHSGGLCCLLSALEDFRVELRTRMMSDAAEKLGSLVQRDRQTGLPKLRINSYFAVSPKRRSALQQTLDLFDNAESYLCAIDNEFFGETALALKTRFSESSGAPPIARRLPYPFGRPEHMLTKATTPTKNVFHRDGDSWVIEFQGRRLPRMKDSLGLRYIHFLIHNQGRHYSAINLYQRMTQKTAEDEENARNAVSNAITRARGKIGSADLWRHLLNCIKTGRKFSYDSRENWDT